MIVVSRSKSGKPKPVVISGEIMSIWLDISELHHSCGRHAREQRSSTESAQRPWQVSSHSILLRNTMANKIHYKFYFSFVLIFPAEFRFSSSSLEVQNLGRCMVGEQQDTGLFEQWQYKYCLFTRDACSKNRRAKQFFGGTGLNISILDLWKMSLWVLHIIPTTKVIRHRATLSNNLNNVIFIWKSFLSQILKPIMNNFYNVLVTFPNRVTMKYAI